MPPATCSTRSTRILRMQDANHPICNQDHEDPQDAGCGNHAWSLTTVGAISVLLVGLTATHELLVGHRLPLWVSRIHARIRGLKVSI